MTTRTNHLSFHSTAATLTETQIDDLSAEAGTHGDMKLVAICRRAAMGSQRARAAVARILRDAKISDSRLYDAATATDIGPATREQQQASYSTGTPEGLITIDADTGEVVPASLEYLYRDQRGAAALRVVYVAR
jgi:hypothetical protein